MENLPYEAMILDLDGVLTDTRALHFEAWQETFDEVIPEGRFGKEDYEAHVDGKRREDGVRSFLASRSIDGSPALVDEIAVKKDFLFKEKLKRRGPRVFEDAVVSLKSWRAAGLPVAVVSSSKNCGLILERAGIDQLIDVRIDASNAGTLRGKPRADYFVEAARRLGKKPQECAIVEDSLAGIHAGVEGHFKGVIGMSREGQTEASKLYAEGAGLVVDSLLKVAQKPHALEAWEAIKLEIGEKEPALFLDYDGTLSPITPTPEEARQSSGMGEILRCCALGLKMAVVSGRDRQDVKHRLGVDNIFYAGCHGFDISGPGGFHYEVEEAQASLQPMQELRQELRQRIGPFPEAIIEEKKYFTAVHYRLVPEEEVKTLSALIHALVRPYKHLGIRYGKKVFEIAPAVKWGKGKTVLKLSELLDLSPGRSLPLFIGDDLTDEDAFRELIQSGIGIKVGEDGIDDSAARYWLRDTVEVERFLELCCSTFAGKEKRWRPGT